MNEIWFELKYQLMEKSPSEVLTVVNVVQLMNEMEDRWLDELAKEVCRDGIV